MCNGYGAIRREDDIYVCDKCNCKYKIKENVCQKEKS